jgi:hypothetical protein
MFSTFGFSIQEFFICYFYCQKTAFVCEFQHTPYGKWFFSQCSTHLVGMRFWGHVRNSLRNKNMERHIPYLLLKMVFLAFKTLLFPLGTGEKTFLSTLNIIILQTVRSECVRFGGHVDIEVRYKILRLDVM